jgi:adenylate cyclase
MIKMNLLPKTIAIISVTLLLTLLGTHFFISQALFENYEGLEQQDLKRDVQIIHNNLQQEAQILEEKLADWSKWDDSYQFALKPNKLFIETNLTQEALVSIRVNAILIFDNKNKLLVSRSYKIENDQVTPWKTDGLLKYILQHPELITHASASSQITGLISFPDENSNTVTFFASEPIIPTNLSPRIAGTIVFFRRFSKGYIEQLLRRQQIEAYFHLIQELAPENSMQQIIGGLRPSRPTLVLPQNEQKVSGFSLIRDVYQKPIFLLEVHKQREIYLQGKHLISNALYVLIILGSFFLIITLLSLRHWVLFPLFVLLKEVQIITRSGDIKNRVRGLGTDEIGVLSHEINTMLESLDIALDKKRQDLLVEKERSDELLNNILPRVIADRMRMGELMIAEHFEEVTVLFSDIVGFTKLSARTAPQELVKLLNMIFSEYDLIADKHGLEKIKTIGDAYMVVSGVPLAQMEHARRIALMALEMRDKLLELNQTFQLDIAVRIGIATGEVIAGIIGKRKFSYDLWGDTVNIAARMESHGIEGKIQCTEYFYQLLHREFVFEPRGLIEVKGKGLMLTYFLIRSVEQLPALNNAINHQVINDNQLLLSCCSAQERNMELLRKL